MLTEPLEPIRIETVPRALVIGGGIAGLRASLGLADIGLSVLLVEKSPSLGGWVDRLGTMYPHGKNGKQLIAQLVDEAKTKKEYHSADGCGAGGEVRKHGQLHGQGSG